MRFVFGRFFQSGCGSTLVVIMVIVTLLAIYIYVAQEGGAGHVYINNSGQAITINKNGIPYQISSGGVRKIFPWVPSDFCISTSNGKNWNYQFKPLEIHAYRIHYNYYFQIEPSGLIYVLPFSADKPVKNLPLQPTGYPLQPIGKGKRKGKGSGTVF